MREIVSPLDGIRSPFGSRRFAFSPLSLFASGEEGAWYEPSTTTAFRSTTDLTPCGYGQSAGFLLDLSKGAGYSGGSFTGLGSELRGGGSPAKVGTATTATYNTSTGEAVVYRVDFSNQSYITVPATTGVKYLISVTNTGAVDAVVWARASPFAGTEFVVVPAGQSSVCYLSAADSGLAFSSATSGGTTAEFTINSVAELPGNHATQSSEPARPILARVPSGGRRNLLERTEEFDDAYWTPQAISFDANTADTTDPVGGNTAYEIIGTDNQQASVYSTASGTGSGNFVVSVYAKAGTVDWVGVRPFGAGTAGTRYFNLTGSGSVGTAYTGGTGSPSATIEAVGNGWYRCKIAYTGITFTAGQGVQIIIADADGTGESQTSASGSSVYIWGAQLEAASSASAYQKVVDQYDITEAGVTSLEYLAFDGSDDGMATASIDFTATDKMSVFAGVEKESDATTGAFLELTATGANTNGGFSIFAPSSSGSNSYNFPVKGTIIAGAGTGVFAPAPSTNIVSGLADIAGDSVILRIDGSEQAATTSDLGTGNFANDALNIGARAGTSLFFDGKLFSLIVRGAASTANEISQTESYVANLTGVSI